jgi:hypothetical protein
VAKLNYIKFTKYCILTGVLAAQLACGKNVFKSGVKSDPAEDSTLALEKNNPDGAISILENALIREPANPQYLSILATAYATRAGIDPLTLGSKFSTSSASLLGDASSTGSITSLFSLMPEATAAVIKDIDYAVNILSGQIPAALRQPGDTFKTAIYMTASMVLHTKALDSRGKGTLTAADIASLSDADANAILNNLGAAAALLSANGAAPGVSSAAASETAAAALTKYSTQIDAAEGTTKAEKLRNYLAANPGATAKSS